LDTAKETMQMKANQRLMLSAVLAAILFGIGYVLAVFIPGAGDTPNSDYTKFYNSDSKMTFAIVLSIVLLIGCMAMLWFFNELRERLPESVLTRLAYSAAILGFIGILAGAAVIGGPAGSKQSTDAAFVGIPTASAFAQAGLSLMLVVGMYSFAFASLLFTIAAARHGLFPKWLNIVGILLAIATFGSFFWIPGYAFVAWVALTGIVVGMREGSPAGASAIASRAPTPVT
jgi:branched-subunit amino acid transport protein